MIPLSTRLDDLDFEALLAIARRNLPGLAPQWTDYNYHDPGITIVELLAWVADSQIYSLARNRHDERLAMARLLGVTPRGAVPATGILYPLSAPEFAQRIERNSILKPVSDLAPRLESAADITMLPVKIARLASRVSNGAILDLTATNERRRASFVPFGDDGAGQLLVELKRTGNLDLDGELLLSLGVELDGDPRDGAPALPHLGEIGVEDERGRAMRLVHDSTHGLQQSGVWIISVAAEQLRQRIVVRRKSGYPLRPRIVQVSPNALPVEQRATLEANRRLVPGSAPEVTFVPAFEFDDDEPTGDRTWQLVDGTSSLRVDIETAGKREDWNRGRLDEAGPADRRYSVDEQPDGRGITLRFGNGVNGRKPSLDDAIEISARLSTGSEGSILKSIDWMLDRQRLRWRNHFPIGGGRDAEGLSDVLNRASARLRDKRVLTSAKQLVEALKPLWAPLEIARADVEEGWEESRRRPAVAATRTLLVASEHAGSETEDWLRTIRQYLVPRVAVGERLIVKAPRYVPFQISVTVDAITGSHPAQVETAIRDELNSRFIKRKDWPLGRDVDASSVSGWVRNLDGVAAVVELKLIVNGREQDHVEIDRGTLPQFREPAEVKIRERPR